MVSFGFILGEIVRRVTGRTLGQYLRTEIAEPLGIDVHIGLPAAEHHRCAEMVNKPHIRDVLANGGAPGYPTTLEEHPMAALSDRDGLHPRRRTRLRRHRRLAVRRIPIHQRPRLGTWACHLLQRARPRQDPQPRAHGEMPRLAGRLRHRPRPRPARRRSRLGPGLHAQPARHERPQHADLRPRRLWRNASGSSTSNTASATPTS